MPTNQGLPPFFRPTTFFLNASASAPIAAHWSGSLPAKPLGISTCTSLSAPALCMALMFPWWFSFHLLSLRRVLTTGKTSSFILASPSKCARFGLLFFLLCAPSLITIYLCLSRFFSSAAVIVNYDDDNLAPRPSSSCRDPTTAEKEDAFIIMNLRHKRRCIHYNESSLQETYVYYLVAINVNKAEA